MKIWKRLLGMVLLGMLLALPGAAEVADYSAGANPEAFGGEYTRELYNVLRYALLTGEESPALPLTGEAMQHAYHDVFAILGSWPGMEECFRLEADGRKVSFRPHYIQQYVQALEHCEELLESLPEKTEEKRARSIAQYILERTTYRAWAYVAPNRVIASEEVIGVNCMSYARAFQLIAKKAGIPCIRNYSAIHSWNEVYVDGQWWVTDMLFLDEGDVPLPENRSTLWPLERKQGKTFEEAAPQAVIFAKELLVPGSTVKTEE